MTTITSTQRHTVPRSLRRLTVVLVTAAAAALVWAIVEFGLGYDLRAPAMGGSPGFDIGLWSVLISSLVAGLAGWASLAALERWSSHGRRIWRVLASVVLIVSLGGPLSGSGLDVMQRAALVTLHIVVATGLIPGLIRKGGTE